jgi:hypothetical protein
VAAPLSERDLQVLRQVPTDQDRHRRIRAGLETLANDGDVVEIRANVDGSWVSGWHRSLDSLAQDVDKWERRECPVYWTPQVLDPRLLAGKPAGTSTTDKEVTSYRYLLIDLDPRRPKDTPSTDEEFLAAGALAKRVVSDLVSQGWPAPAAWGSSGNGIHVYWRIDLPVSDRDLVKRVLHALAARYSTDLVDLDKSVHNPSRIMRCYGTINRKGDSTDERPHRQACLLPLERLTEAPEGLVSREALEALCPVTERPPRRAKVPVSKTDDGLAEDLISLARTTGLEVRGPEAWEDGQRWVFVVCPTDPAHQDRSAYLLTRSSGAVTYGCHHNGCQGKGLRDLREALRDRLEARGAPVPDWLGGLPPWEEVDPLDPWSTPAWPSGLLPAVLEAYTDAVSECNQTPPDQSKALSLVVVAAAVQDRYLVDIGGRRENLAQAVGIGADSAERKSADLAYLRGPLDEFESLTRLECRDRMAALEAERQILEAQRTALIKRAVKTGEDLRLELQEVLARLATLATLRPRRLLTQDVTPEALASLLAEQRSITLLSAEGGPFENMAGKYSQRPDLANVYLQGYSGEVLTTDRKSSGTYRIDAPALSMGIMTQPKHLRGVLTLPVFSGRGLLERFFWVLPDPRVGSRDVETARPVPSHLSERYARTLRALLPPTTPVSGSHDPRTVLEISADGQRTLIDLAKELEPRYLPDGDLYHVRAWGARLPTLAAKVATLWHLVDAASQGRTVPGIVAAKWVTNAVTLVREYAIPMGLKTWALMGSESATDHARQILGALQGHDRLTVRAIARAKRNLTKEDLQAGLTLLEERGYIRRTRSTSGRPGRPSEWIEANPFFKSEAPKPPDKTDKTPLSPPQDEFRPFCPGDREDRKMKLVEECEDFADQGELLAVDFFSGEGP